MSFISLGCLLIFFLVGLFVYDKTQAQEDGRFRLYVLGDSLSSGYGLNEEESFCARLSQALVSQGYNNVQVINGSIPGETAENAIRRLDNVMTENPHAIILELGINDFSSDTRSEVIEQNLDKIITFFKEKDIPVLLIGMAAPQGSVLGEREKFPLIYQRLAKKHKLILYPYFLKDVLISRFGVFDYKYLQPDGEHPNAEGVMIMVKNIMPYVKRFFKTME